MNRKEWLRLPGNRYICEYKQVQQPLQRWKEANGITERCTVHHRDDTEECIKYNEAHYERFGLNEDGTFEYGKYVVFMTQVAHLSYHTKGKKFTDEHKQHLSESHTGKEFTDEHRQHISESVKETKKAIKYLYNVYRKSGGELKLNDFMHALKNGEITFEQSPISVYTTGGR